MTELRVGLIVVSVLLLQSIEFLLERLDVRRRGRRISGVKTLSGLESGQASLDKRRR